MWIVRNYDRLQKRVEQIRKTGEGTYAFYPGSWYKLHSTLYGKLWKKLILQTAVLMILSMLYLMDYERIYKTQDLVLATTTGKKMMEKKMLAGTLCGLFYAGLLTVFTLLVFFAAVPFQNLWHVPVAACMVAEPRLQMMYPFVTFWWLEQWRYLFACAGGACGTAWDRCGCYCRSAVVFTEQLFFVCGIGSSFYGGISACLCADGKCVGSYPGII